ncbi:calcium/calmodulin-dependent protein kinase type 1B [Colletotrichum musicola]|uniref:Calcium/calmodulin-dependent protein kinase type 1B n=1 Tax=Colletotrichum musicola TaxID=2175873 RepID=A0A8H6MU69_9PEZI|nr:calcium/calmodulin-dependent protein kinase type 1B [Colletotrichum musicola]
MTVKRVTTSRGSAADDTKNCTNGTKAIDDDDDDDQTLAQSSDDDTATIVEKPSLAPAPPVGPLHPFNQDNIEILRSKIVKVTEERRNRKSSFASKALKAAAWVIIPGPPKHDRSRLCFACGALNVDLAAQLIDDGVPINADANFGHGALMAVIRAKPSRPAAQEAMIDFLVAEGADVNYLGQDGITPLSATAEEGHTILVGRLLDHGARINDARTTMVSWKWFVGQNMTALHVAVSKGVPECFQLLIDRGADCRMEFRLSNYSKTSNLTRILDFAEDTVLDDVTPLHIAVNDIKCVTGLLRLGADMMARDSRGRTPFHWAVDAANVSVVILFLDKGYPVDDPGEDGVTAMGMICAALERGTKPENFPVLTKQLLQAGADIEIVYPQDLSIKKRWLMMDDWRDVYAPIFLEFCTGKNTQHGR